jgi:hypothetical protein
MWAEAQRAELRAATGLRYYRGVFGSSHYEFPLLCMRADRNSAMRAREHDWMLPSFRARLRAQIVDELNEPGDVLISAEGLSYLRHDDEVRELRELLAPRVVKFVVVLRNRQDFLRSYREEMAREGFPPSTYEESFAYTNDSTWLTDYPALLRAFSNPTVVNYEDALDRYGSIIPALLEACVGTIPPLRSWQGIWENTTNPNKLESL